MRKTRQRQRMSKLVLKSPSTEARRLSLSLNRRGEWSDNLAGAATKINKYITASGAYMSRQPAVTIPPPENAAARSTRGELQHARQKRRAETRPAGHTGVGGGGRDAAAFTCRGDMTFRAL